MADFAFPEITALPISNANFQQRNAGDAGFYFSYYQIVLIRGIPFGSIKKIFGFTECANRSSDQAIIISPSITVFDSLSLLLSIYLSSTLILRQNITTR